MYDQPMELDGYVRVSRVAGRDGDNFISPRVQRERIEAFAALHGHRVIDWHQDLDEPGSRADRPGFQAALERVETGATAGIAVAKLDRFARSVADAAAAIRRIDAAGGQLVSVEDNFDSSTPMGRFAMHMLLALGELELARIRESWATSQAYAVERGIHIASRPPTGYRRGKDGRLEPVKRDAAVIHDVFRLRAAGSSWRQLADLLMQRGVVGPYGNAQWTTSAVSKLVANPVYTGEARSGSNRKQNAHPAIVSMAEWQAAQGARSPSVPRSGDGALLSGILRCGGCRYVLKPDTMNGRDGEKLRIYRCRGEHAAGRCPEPATVMGRVIEPYVESVFLDALGDNGPLGRATRSTADLDEARRSLAEAESELELWISLSVTGMGKDSYVAGLAERERRVDEAREHLQDALAAAAGPLGDVPDLVHLRGLWSELGVGERRRLLAAGLDAIVLFRGREAIEDRAIVLFHGEAPVDLPARGRRVPLRGFERPLGLGVADAENVEIDEPDRPTSRRRHRAKAAA
jgi:DNA invertase Pin-like site-specific DNA recombinase